jgi:aryl-alcohol dehydrogenase-like predicted oxidoreductase
MAVLLYCAECNFLPAKRGLMPSAAPLNEERKSRSATAEGTLRYAARFQGRAAPGHFREIRGGLVLSSIGIGTYLGEPDEATDGAYADTVVAAVEGGINVVDSAINYRFQRSERAVGQALRELFHKGFGRDEIMVCTKAGFLTPDGEMPADPNTYFSQEFLERGVFRVEDIAAGCHCMAPGYLADQLDRSRRNLGLETIDVFYLHNPETQLSEVPPEEFRQRIREAFLFLEAAVASKQIRAYGMATWNSFREDPKAAGFLSLAEMVQIAKDVAGDDHHFRFVQLPFNLAMPEALTRPNQAVDGRPVPMVQAARATGVALVTSAALLQGQLTKNLPAFINGALGLKDNASLALQFARSVPGLTTALVGMSQVRHVRANLELIGVEPASREQFMKLFEQRS